MKVLAAALLALCAAAPAWAGESEAEFRATTVHLSATGEVRAAPDLAVVRVGVETQAGSATDALAQNRTRMNAAVSALRAQGVAPADIQTSSLSLQPQYAFAEGQPRRLTGYQAENTVNVRLHDMGAVGRVVDALVAAGANQIDSISFEIADRTAAENAARRDAVAKLHAQAELFAQASGYQLGRLVQLSEGQTFAPPRPVVFARAMVASAPTAIEPGELDVSETVSGEYELTR